MVTFQLFQGKQDLEKNLTRRLKAWLAPNTRFVVMRDQDAADCKAVKAGLLQRVKASGRAHVLVRVACRDLESWVLGDWAAIARAFERPQLADNQNKAAFRDPDAVVNGVDALRKYVPEYQKRDGARRLGLLLDPQSNRSTSFKAFCTGLAKLVNPDMAS